MVYLRQLKILESVCRNAERHQSYGVFSYLQVYYEERRASVIAPSLRYYLFSLSAHLLYQLHFSCFDGFLINVLGKYFDEISQDTGRYCFGVEDTLKVCMDLFLVKMLRGLYPSFSVANKRQSFPQ